MSRRMVMALALAIGTGLPVGLAHADHLTVTPEARPDDSRPPADVLLDLKVDPRGFRLGGRVLGERGVYGAWVDGRLKGDGVAIEGEVQDGSRTRSYRIELNASGLELVARALARRWLLGD